MRLYLRTGGEGRGERGETRGGEGMGGSMSDGELEHWSEGVHKALSGKVPMLAASRATLHRQCAV